MTHATRPSRLILLLLSLMAVTAQSAAMANQNTTTQVGRININHTHQCGDSNTNTTYQEGQININRTRQGCEGQRVSAGRSGASASSRAETARGRLPLAAQLHSRGSR